MTYTPERTALKRICSDIGLPIGNEFTQNWIYELEEKYRSNDYLEKYLAAYLCPAYGVSERELLIRLILDIVNDRLQESEQDGRKNWLMTLAAIGNHLSNHIDAIEYWSVKGEPLDDAFALTPLIREWAETKGLHS